MPITFDDFAAVLLDFDGTLCRKEQELPGARRFVERLERERRRWAVLSNSTRGPRTVARRLASAGIEIASDQIYTAAAAACDWVCDNAARRDDHALPRVFNLATPDVDELLAGRAQIVDAGPEDREESDTPTKPSSPTTHAATHAATRATRATSATSATSASRADAVIVGTPCDARATPDRQRLALLHIRAGAKLVGTSGDRVFPSARGLEFGAGALTCMLAHAADATPVFTGKPEPIFFQELCRRLGVEPEDCLLIGDNLEADIMGGRRVGMTTILVLSGVTGRGELRGLPEARRPHEVVENVAELLEW